MIDVPAGISCLRFIFKFKEPDSRSYCKRKRGKLKLPHIYIHTCTHAIKILYPFSSYFLNFHSPILTCSVHVCIHMHTYCHAYIHISGYHHGHVRCIMSSFLLDQLFLNSLSLSLSRSLEREREFSKAKEITQN